MFSGPSRGCGFPRRQGSCSPGAGVSNVESPAFAQVVFYVLYFVYNFSEFQLTFQGPLEEVLVSVWSFLLEKGWAQDIGDP